MKALDMIQGAERLKALLLKQDPKALPPWKAPPPTPQRDAAGGGGRGGNGGAPLSALEAHSPAAAQSASHRSEGGGEGGEAGEGPSCGQVQVKLAPKDIKSEDQGAENPGAGECCICLDNFPTHTLLGKSDGDASPVPCAHVHACVQ
jgi:hypothetical protein